jgi:hypothetical protein
MAEGDPMDEREARPGSLSAPPAEPIFPEVRRRGRVVRDRRRRSRDQPTLPGLRGSGPGWPGHRWTARGHRLRTAGRSPAMDRPASHEGGTNVVDHWDPPRSLDRPHVDREHPRAIAAGRTAGPPRPRRMPIGCRRSGPLGEPTASRSAKLEALTAFPWRGPDRRPAVMDLPGRSAAPGDRMPDRRIATALATAPTTDLS